SMNSYRINALSKDVEDVTKEQLVLHVGYHNKSFSEFLNSNFLRQQNFKFVHTPRLYRTNNKRLRNVSNQKTYITNLKSEITRPIRMIRAEPLKRDDNLIIDISNFINFELESMTMKNRETMRNNLKATIDRFLYDNYKHTLIVFNLDGLNTSAKEMLKESNLSTISSINTMIKREIPIVDDKDTKVTLLFTSVRSGLFMKVGISDQESVNSNKALFRTRLKSLVGSINQDEKITVTNPEKDDTENTEDDTDIKGKRMNAISTTNRSKSTLTKDKVDKEEQKEENNLNNSIEDKVEVVLATMKTDETMHSMDKDDETKLKSIITQELKDNPELVDVDDNNLIDGGLNHNDVYRSLKNNIQRKTLLGDNMIRNSKKIISLANKQDEVIDKLDIKLDYKDKSIEKKSNLNISVIDDEARKNTSVKDFDNSYMEKQFNKDFVDNLRAFNDNPSIPVFIHDVKVEDTSDSQTYKKTVNAKFRDTNNVIHSMTFDIPKIYDGKYMKINGGKKILTKQLFMNPIVKYKPDEVWVTTNYNKFIIEKFGDK